MKKSLLLQCLKSARDYLPKHPELGKSFPHFSFIVQNNQIIEWGINRKGTFPNKYTFYKRLNRDVKYHAEFVAFSKAIGILDKNDGFICINIRLRANGEIAMSKPCPCCLDWLKMNGCTGFYFTTNDGWAKLIF